MPRLIVATGAAISGAGGRAYQVTANNNGGWHLTYLPGFPWAGAHQPAHRHYEIEIDTSIMTFTGGPPVGVEMGSFWVPVSSHPPNNWPYGATKVAATDKGMQLEDETPQGGHMQQTMEATSTGTKIYRPKDILFWIPDNNIGQHRPLGVPEETSLEIDF